MAAYRLSQCELVGAILEAVDRLGAKHASVRQMNAVIAAANDIVAAFEKDDTRAAPGAGLGAWLASDDTGASSRYLAVSLARAAGIEPRQYPGGRPQHEKRNHPHDPDDFGRCVRMLDVVPYIRPYLPAEMAKPEHGPVWNALAAAWDDLESLYAAEKGKRAAPKLYARIRAIIDGATATRPGGDSPAGEPAAPSGR